MSLKQLHTLKQLHIDVCYLDASPTAEQDDYAKIAESQDSTDALPKLAKPGFL